MTVVAAASVAADRVGAGADRGGERDLVDVPRARARRRLVADDEHERHARLRGLGQAVSVLVKPAPYVAVAAAMRPDARKWASAATTPPASWRTAVKRAVVCALEGVEEVGVAVAHDAEDVVDVAREGDGDVGGDGGHDDCR